MKKFAEEVMLLKQICTSEQFRGELEAVKRLCANRPLILYGAGSIGHSVVRLLQHCHIEVNCFCDKNKGGMRDETGIPIIFPNQIAAQYPEANIIVCSVNYKDEITQDLKALGVDQRRIHFRDILHLHEMTYEDMLPYLEGYQRVFDLFEDDKSRQILLERIRCYLTSKPITSSGSENQYFDPEIISLSGQEVFVDGGMYTGDTAMSFFRFCGNQYAHYYGFEPDRSNYIAAAQNLKNQARLTLVQKGLWNREVQLSFSGNLNSSSRLEKAVGSNLVDVTALDVYFQNREAPTFIKMDIEGAELEALKGSEHLICCRRPKLAICAYHHPEDIYTLLELIKSYRSDYKFYLRHYTNTIYETVLYAV